jgi:hypothetical protein
MAFGLRVHTDPQPFLSDAKTSEKHTIQKVLRKASEMPVG